MVGIGSILKLARGELGPDELKEILSAAGMELEFNPVAPSLETFRPLAASVSLPGSKLLELKGNNEGRRPDPCAARDESTKRAKAIICDGHRRPPFSERAKLLLSYFRS